MPCKNNAAFSYTGKEMSPLGLGFCADAESVNKDMVGRDGKSWVVGVKNGNKMWMRAPEPVLVKEEPVLPNETVKEEPVLPKETVKEEPVLPKETVNSEPVVDSDGEELPPLEEMTVVDEEETLEDPFGWTPTDTLEVTEEPKEEEKPKEDSKEGNDTPKKRGRPAKPKAEKSSEENKEGNDTPKKRGRPAKPKAEKSTEETKEANETPKKRGRPAKPKEEKPVEMNENGEVVKPKRKYTRKPKLVEGEIVVEEVEKKERKPRAKTEYNEFLGKTMKELREKHKDNTELKTTDYMKMAIAEWKTYKISKVGV
jgi:hypothetical protein